MFTVFDSYPCRLCISNNFLLRGKSSSSRCFIFPDKTLHDVSSSADEQLLKNNFFIRIFFDNHMDRYLPIAIAQASIFWLYVCYIYYFLQCKKESFFSMAILLI